MKKGRKLTHLSGALLPLSLIDVAELLYCFSGFTNVSHRREFKAEDTIYLSFGVLRENVVGHVFFN